MRRLVSYYCSASVTSVNDYVALLGIGLGLDRTEDSATVVGPVSGVDINVQGAKAEGTVISRRISERQYLLAAVLAYKSAVVFCKSFVFHIGPFSVLFSRSEEKITKINLGGFMKKVFGILALACMCIALGLSVKQDREEGVSLVVSEIDRSYCGGVT